MTASDRDISRSMSHALRHEPDRYGLELAPDGSVPVDALVSGLSAAGIPVTAGDVARVVAESDKRRFAIEGDRVRAIYGHSTESRIAKADVVPHGPLWHATSASAAAAILQSGLLPMGRQYVHLAADPDTAVQAGRRKSPRPVLLRIDAVRAAAEGVRFVEGHERVTLADVVPPAYITIVEPLDEARPGVSRPRSPTPAPAP